MGDQLEQPTNTALSDEERYNSLPYHKRTWFRAVVVVLPQVIVILQSKMVEFNWIFALVIQLVIWFACCLYIFHGKSKTTFNESVKNFMLLFTISIMLFVTFIIMF